MAVNTNKLYFKLQVSRVNTNFIRSITQQSNQSQILTNKNATCPAHQRKTKTVSNYDEHIFEPIVEIISGSQDLTTVSASTDVPNHVSYPKEYKSSRKNNLGASDTTTSAKEKYVFVVMNNVAPATSPDGPLRIVDIKSAVSGDRYPLGNVTVKNVTFSADKVRSTISEVIENLPDKQNIDLNSTEVNHEYLLVLNSSIRFNIKDVPPENPIGLLTTQSSNKNLFKYTRPVSECGARRDSLNYPDSVTTSLENNYHYETRSKLAASKGTVEKFKEGLTKRYLTDNKIKKEPGTSVKEENGIPKVDNIYIFVVDDDCDNAAEVVKFCGKSDNDKDKEQHKEISDCSENREEIVPNTIKRVNFKSCKKRYFCKRCEKSFNSIKLLKNHDTRKCYRNRNITSNKKERLDREIHRTENAQEMQCTEQAKGINTQPLGYERTGTDECYVTCAKCKAVFKNRTILKQHILTVCNKKETADHKCKIVCDICGKVYYKTSQFQAHMDAHENLRQFKCSECNSGFNKRWFLVRHIAQVHRKSRYMYFCSYCGLKSESKEHIEMHEQVHTLPEGADVPRPYRCLCGKSYISKHSLRCHKYSSLCHGIRKEIALKCPLCSKMLASALSLSFHLEGKHNVNPTRGERAINCNRCDKKFTWFGSYVRHKLITHEAEVEASEVEPYVGGQPASARQYRPRSQGGPPTNPQVCQICDRECKSKSALNAHKWYHHSEARKIKMESAVPVSCDLCHKAFGHKNSLMSHYHRYHRPREPGQLSCRICHKVFNNYGGLWSHNKYVHIKTLPYDCAVCGSKFKRKGDQTRHLKDKHGIVKPNECYGYEVNETAKEEYDAETVTDKIGPDLGSCSFEMMSYTQL